ncbi:LD-carboxypeptidase [Paenibacillus sp. CECT 9249]|uniref:LD-carboxypeptidase n=1 Tax=Paenibacillus sp. CECT 9249 TaxID=2845385 RepID=UPI001E5DD8DA|nr:LD-carboxypeptidase [Paenibacillus sp. CECT 9249]
MNTEVVRNNPKFIMGFSDATTFLSYFNQLGVITFYGPSVMAGLAQLKSLPSEHADHLKSIFFSHSYPYRYSPFRKWTNGIKIGGNCKH